MISIKGLVKTIRIFARKKKPQLLVGTGIAMSIAADLLVGKATVKAVRAYDKAAAEKGRKLTKKEVLATCGRFYIWPLGVEAAATTATITGLGTSLKRTATALAAAEVALTTVDDMKKAAKETLDESQYKEFCNKLKDTPNNQPLLVANSNSKLTFKDAYTNQKFMATMNEVDRWVNELNAEINTSMYVTKNNWLAKIGLPPVEDGDDIGWYQLLELMKVPELSDDGQEVYISLKFWDCPVSSIYAKAYGHD